MREAGLLTKERTKAEEVRRVDYELTPIAAATVLVIMAPCWAGRTRRPRPQLEGERRPAGAVRMLPRARRYDSGLSLPTRGGAIRDVVRRDPPRVRRVAMNGEQFACRPFRIVFNAEIAASTRISRSGTAVGRLDLAGRLRQPADRRQPAGARLRSAAHAGQDATPRRAASGGGMRRKSPALFRRDPNVNQRYVLDGVVVAGCRSGCSPARASRRASGTGRASSTTRTGGGRAARTCPTRRRPPASSRSTTTRPPARRSVGSRCPSRRSRSSTPRP